MATARVDLTGERAVLRFNVLAADVAALGGSVGSIDLFTLAPTLAARRWRVIHAESRVVAPFVVSTGERVWAQLSDSLSDLFLIRPHRLDIGAGAVAPGAFFWGVGFPDPRRRQTRAARVYFPDAASGAHWGEVANGEGWLSVAPYEVVTQINASLVGAPSGAGSISIELFGQVGVNPSSTPAANFATMSALAAMDGLGAGIPRLDVAPLVVSDADRYKSTDQVFWGALAGAFALRATGDGGLTSAPVVADVLFSGLHDTPDVVEIGLEPGTGLLISPVLWFGTQDAVALSSIVSGQVQVSITCEEL
jgi:hypothetical protein